MQAQAVSQMACAWLAPFCSSRLTTVCQLRKFTCGVKTSTQKSHFPSIWAGAKRERKNVSSFVSPIAISASHNVSHIVVWFSDERCQCRSSADLPVTSAYCPLPNRSL
ncbi:hypothetical protein BKA67DRAFT_379487 [Truncatella angustata]|uniref:Uncharacterized protein n=1 Tax=Truncatella angustata TaxID=152316 RepID=A0A9P8UFN6_9PEZI|nr:uncharacterized protein BKA67DRAFT_379487 [Truncatella angustata]KAH6649015.1 hypothetical protein BKA67DRAFT_379487 [Truncatella angustata]